MIYSNVRKGQGRQKFKLLDASNSSPWQVTVMRSSEDSGNYLSKQSALAKLTKSIETR